MADQTSSARGADLRNQNSHEGIENRDATLEFKLTADRMAAFISAYTPAQGHGAPLSIELMKSELRKAGYDGDLDHDGAMFALKRAGEGKSIINVALIRGKYPQDAEDGRIISDADFNFPVIPGMVFGRLLEAVPSASGITLMGDEIPPNDTHIPQSLEVAATNAGCSLDYSTDELFAETYGLVKIENNKVFVEPLIEVSPDHMKVKAKLYPHDCFGRRYELHSLEPALKDLDISRPLLHMAGQTAIQKARDTRTIQETVIVHGSEPVPGTDGRFEYAKKDLDSSIGTTGEDDRIDFKDRGIHPMVQPGEIIGQIHPPIEGKAGEDIYGRLTPPPGGTPLEIKPGIGVAPMADGIIYQSTATGIVNLQDGVLSVQDVLITKADVDYSTGNIILEKGSVHVNGSIRQGFTVNAPDHIIVKDSIEGATVIAGGDLEVKGGLVMGGKGSIKTGGNITAQFAANSHIECGDELIINNEINNCMIRCKGTITAHGSRGIIQGGIVSSQVGIEAKELGSDIGVKTVLAINAKPPINRELIKERDELRARLLKINAAIGQGSSQDILESVSASKREKMEQILMIRGRIKVKLKQIRAQLYQEQEAYHKSLEKLSIRVHRRVYPGVEIKIGGKTVQVSKVIPRIKFRFDAEERTIVAVKW